MAASQSSTELKVLKSGMDLSNSGWEGLQWGERRQGVRGDLEQGFDAIFSKKDLEKRKTMVRTLRG